MTTKLVSKVYAVQDAWEFYELAHRSGWTDGLPVLPPTEERVRAMLEYSQRDPAEVLGSMPPMGGQVSIEKVAINAVMAGCVPEYFPVVVAAVECVLENRDKQHFNLRGVVDTTNAVTPLIIVSGPAVSQLGFHYHENAFGGGNASRANATVGRALRLVIWNGSGARPGTTDMTSLGHPGKYSYCIAENPNPDENPWTKLNVEYGYPADQSIVMVFACEAPRGILTYGGQRGTPLGALRLMADSIATPGANQAHALGQVLVTFNPRTVSLLMEAGYTKEMARKFLWEEARLKLSYLISRGFHDPRSGNGSWRDYVPWFDQTNPENRPPYVEREENLLITVTGGIGIHWNSICHGWGHFGGYAVTKPIRFPGRGSARV